jgi:uracil-DNA glycosylase
MTMTTAAPGPLEKYHRDEVVGCTRCALSQTRTQVVTGSGDSAAAVMFVGEAPGYHEDQSGVPFVGAAGKLLDTMLAGIGMTRADVFVANVLKCRPPENRDPLPAEITSCEPHLFRQIGIIRPRLVCTLGNFALKLLSGRPEGISKVHGHELALTLGGVAVLLYPLYHPAAALYAPAMRGTLEADFARIPELIAKVGGAGPTAQTAPASEVQAPVESTPSDQLGLF